MDEFASLLPRGLAALGMETDAEVEEKLRRYIVELETWNPTYGLVNATGEELVIKHILDSLAPWKLLKATLESCDTECFPGAAGASKVSDIGTGAGLPGIPLAIAMKERGFRLVERMGKRVTFLESQKALLPLPNVEIVESEVERAPGPHDVVVFRAFRPLTETRLFRSIWKNLRPGGALFAYKGKALNVKLELAALATDPLLAGPMSRARIEPVWVPFLDEDRCVVIIRKEEESQPIL